jgi:hypothetical protein
MGYSRYREVRRKRPSIWPWLGGVAMVVLIAWGVTGLLAAPGSDEEVPDVVLAEDTLPPAAIPIPPQPVREQERIRGVEDLIPLDDRDVGEEVRAEGEVVATGTDGFWMVVGGEVIRVDSERPVRRGDVVRVLGSLHPTDGERTDRIVSEVLSRSPRAQSWRVVRSPKLVEGDAEGVGGAAPTGERDVG